MFRRGAIGNQTPLGRGTPKIVLSIIRCWAVHDINEHVWVPHGTSWESVTKPPLAVVVFASPVGNFTLVALSILISFTSIVSAWSGKGLPVSSSKTDSYLTVNRIDMLHGVVAPDMTVSFSLITNHPTPQSFGAVTGGSPMTTFPKFCLNSYL